MATKSKQEARVDRSAKRIENFKKLASKRVSRVLQGIDGITKLANRRSYTYTSEQVTKILTALKSRFDAMEKAFSSVATDEDHNKFEV